MKDKPDCRSRAHGRADGYFAEVSGKEKKSFPLPLSEYAKGYAEGWKRGEKDKRE